MKNLRLNKEIYESLAVLRNRAEAEQMKLIHKGISPSWTNFKKTDYFKRIKGLYSEETIEVFKKIWRLK